MKAHLLFPDRDFDRTAPLAWNAAALTTDLGLDTLFAAMACEDERVLDISRKVILAGGGSDLDVIAHRQGVLEDCLNNPLLVRSLYAMTLEILEIERRRYLGSMARYPETVLTHAVDLMTQFLTILGKLRGIADREARHFVSTGWETFFNTLRRELSDDFLQDAARQVDELKRHGGTSLGAGLGDGNKAMGYVLHRPLHWTEAGFWRKFLEWLFPPRRPPHSFDVHPLDESGVRALNEIRKQGLAVAARTLGQATDHVFAFFVALREELAFYVGCLNLRDALVRKRAALCLPQLFPPEARRHAFQGLYDVGLALTIDQETVDNDLNADARNPLLVTGANQGGKSTFLRSIGLAQIMAQAGMFAPARTYASSLCGGLFTHYKREEDAEFEAGKLDEELRRMSEIVSRITSHPMLLLNEPFSSTNEREGSEIGWQVLSALLESGARIVCVTHLYDLASRFRSATAFSALFLRPERRSDGSRTFRLVAGEPLATSFGQDLFAEVFAERATAPMAPQVRRDAAKILPLPRAEPS